MHTMSVPPALRERLGHDATIGLQEYVESQHMAWSEQVLSIGVEKFERRLAVELADLRVALVREIHEGRSETLKWAFGFWVGQLAAFAALLVIALRITGR